MAGEKVFSSDVDNQTHLKEVRNFIIGPVYPHSTGIMNDQSKVEFDRQKPIGVVQLLNKKNFKQITEYDIKKFEAMQTLLGLSIDQTAETHSTINIRIGVQNKLTNVDELIDNQVNLQTNHDNLTLIETNSVL